MVADLCRNPIGGTSRSRWAVGWPVLDRHVRGSAFRCLVGIESRRFATCDYRRDNHNSVLNTAVDRKRHQRTDCPGHLLGVRKPGAPQDHPVVRD